VDNSSVRLNYIDIKEFLYKFFDFELNNFSAFNLLLQLAFIAWLIYQVYKRFRGTQAERVLRGLIFITPAILLCYTLKLGIITRLIEIFSPTILIGLIVIFAPEFRRVLMQIGGTASILEYTRIGGSKFSVSSVTTEILKALKHFQMNKIGALIIIEMTQAERYYINPGHLLYAKLSFELLLSIFNPKSPLHDGAVTVRGQTIIAAGVILPMTENPKLDWQYGTRHRAAIGFSEVTDALCIVVSEETGGFSIAYQGRLTHYNSLEQMRVQIEKYYIEVLKMEKRNRPVNRYMADLVSSLKTLKQKTQKD